MCYYIFIFWYISIHIFLEDQLLGLRILFRCSSDVCKLRIDFDTMVLADPFSVSDDTSVIFAFLDFTRSLVYEILIWSQCVCTLHWYICFLVNLNLDIEHLVWSWRDKNRYISDFCVCVIMSLAPSSLSSSGSLSQFQIFNLAPTLFSVKSEICFQNQINSRRLPHWHLDCHKSRRINTSRWLYHHLFHLVTTLTAV